MTEGILNDTEHVVKTIYGELPFLSTFQYSIVDRSDFMRICGGQMMKKRSND